MTGRERSEIAELKLWLIGEDGTGGLNGQVMALRSDMDKIKGALILASKAIAFLGFSGGLWLIGALVHAAAGGAAASP